MHSRHVFLAVAAGLLFACSPACAVVQIGDVLWYSYTNEILPTGSLLMADFTARATATDLASGVRFSLLERDPDGDDLLFDVALQWTPPYPALGSEVRVSADFRQHCNQGQLVADYVGNWFVTWCDPNLGMQVRTSTQGFSLRTGTSEPESFEFVLADETGAEAPGATPDDAYHCAALELAQAEPLFTSPHEFVRQGLPVATESELRSRREPATEAESGGTIQLAFDPLGEHACGDIAVGVPATLYVVARRAGPALCGVVGAELRIVGLPPEWIASAAIPPGSISLGDPLGPVGGDMAYSSCQAPPGSPVLLYTISIFATSAVSDRVVEVTARTPPANPNFNCPLVTLCDVPIYSIVCLNGSQARINPPAGTDCGDVTVGVEPHSWSGVKALYR
jgi:hypothetical protein